MKALFVDISRDFYDKNWIYALAPVLRGMGVETCYLPLRKIRIRAGDLAPALDAKPDLVLYSAFTADMPKITDVDREMKRLLPKSKSLLGGAAPTFDWTCHRGTTLDAICVGEGELALTDYIESGFEGGRNVIPAGRSGPERLADFVSPDELPLPDRSLVYAGDPLLAAVTAKQFMAGRGCPYQCTYCFNSSYNRKFKTCGPVIRQRSVDRVLEEIEAVRRRWPLTLISFQDDTFIINKPWLLEFCERLPEQVGLPFSCNVRANLLSEDVICALRDGGCVAVSWSIESGNDHLRNEVLRRNMSRETILEAGRLLHQYGITQRVANVIGIPGETKEQLHETIELNIAVRPQIATGNIFVPYPGLRLTEYAKETGYLSEGEALPRDVFTRSVLKFSEEHRQYLRKTSCLFPFFARHGWAFKTRWVRAILYALPWIVTRVAYEAFFLFVCMRLYRIGGGVRIHWEIFRRYVQNLL